LKALRRCERLRELEFGKGSGVRKSAASSDGSTAAGPLLSSLRSPSPTPTQQQHQQQWGNNNNNPSPQRHATFAPGSSAGNSGSNRIMTIDDSWAAVATAALAAGATVVYPAPTGREEKGAAGSSSSSSLPSSPFRSSLLRRSTGEQPGITADAAALVVIRPLRAASSGHVRALLARAPSLSRVDLGEEGGKGRKGSASSSSSRLVLTSRDAAAASLRGLGLGCLLDVAAALEAAAAAAAGVAARVKQRGVSSLSGSGPSILWPAAGRRVAPDS